VNVPVGPSAPSSATRTTTREPSSTDWGDVEVQQVLEIALARAVINRHFNKDDELRSRTLQVLRLFFPNVIDRQAPACEGSSTLTHVV